MGKGALTALRKTSVATARSSVASCCRAMSRSAPSTSSPSRWISSLSSERSPEPFQSAAKSTDRSSAKSVETTRPVATSTSLTCIFDMPEPMSKAARRRRPERSAIVPALSSVGR